MIQAGEGNDAIGPSLNMRVRENQERAMAGHGKFSRLAA
jgi:hypothetical protein